MNTAEEKLTENEVVLYLKTYLEKNGWVVGDNFCLGQKHGRDIEAQRDGEILVVEVKGARSGAETPVRKHFDSGQIKTHFGKAIVTIMQEIHSNPNYSFAIAHPDDKEIRRAIGHLTPMLKKLGVKHFWVLANGIVVED